MEAGSCLACSSSCRGIHVANVSGTRLEAESTGASTEGKPPSAHLLMSSDHPAHCMQIYFIHMPGRNHMDSYSLKAIKESVIDHGWAGEIVMVNGTYDGRYGCVLCRTTSNCDPAGCQIGLSLAHLFVWQDILLRQLEAAWVFEDDVVFHTRFKELFPLYWRQVPINYEAVWIGQHAVGGVDVACEHPPTSHQAKRWYQTHHVPYTTHAMIVSKAGARRFSKAMQGIIARSIDSKRSLTMLEIKIDLFLIYVHQSFLFDLTTWVTLEPNAGNLAEWGGHSWCRLAPHEIFFNGSCTCESCSPEQWPGSVPLLGSGLAFQNMCKKDRYALHKWGKNSSAV